MVVLEFLKAIIDNFGSAIVVPFIIFIIALIFRVKPAKAFLSALYAGVSLEGFSLIIGAWVELTIEVTSVEDSTTHSARIFFTHF